MSIFDPAGPGDPGDPGDPGAPLDPQKPKPNVAPAPTPDDAEFQRWLATQQKSSTGAVLTHDDAEYQAWLGQQPKPRSTLYNALNTIDQAFLFGGGQKFNAAWNAVGDKMAGRDSYTHSYTTNLDAEFAGIDQLRAAHPYASGALGAIGTLPAMIAAAPVEGAELAGSGIAAIRAAARRMLGADVATGASLGQRTAAAAKVGGALGAIGSFGNADNRGSVGEQTMNALKSAAMGSGLSAGMVPASEIIARAAAKLGATGSQAIARVGAPNDESSPAFQRVAGAIPQEIAGGAAAAPPPQPDKASTMLIRGLQRAGLTPQDAIARLSAMPESKPVSIMEIADDQSHPLRQIGKWVARTPSAGQAQLRSAVATRAEPLSSAQRVLGDVADAMDVQRTNLVANDANLKTQQFQNAQPFYAASVDNPNTPPVSLDAQSSSGTALSDLFERPSVKSAVKTFNKNAAEQGQKPLALPTRGDEATAERPLPPMPPNFASSPDQWAELVGVMRERGISIPGDTPAAAAAPKITSVPLKTLQSLKFSLDDAISHAEDTRQFPDGTAATNQTLKFARQTRQDLLDIMTNHSNQYGLGNESWAGDQSVIDAGRAGQRFLAQPFNELQSEYPVRAPEEQTQYRTNALSGPIRDRLYNTNAVDRAKILMSPDMQERLGVVVPSGRMSQFQQNVALEHEIALTNQAIPNGSDTFENAANEADNGGQMAKGLLTGLLGGRPHSAVRSVIRGVVRPAVDSWVHGVNEQTANALAPKLTAGMQSRAEIMQVLEDLADQYARLRGQRPTPPLLGAATGITIGQLGPGTRGF